MMERPSMVMSLCSRRARQPHAGTLNLSGSSSYGGATNVNVGTLQAATVNAFASQRGTQACEWCITSRQIRRRTRKPHANLHRDWNRALGVVALSLQEFVAGTIIHLLDLICGKAWAHAAANARSVRLNGSRLVAGTAGGFNHPLRRN
jgi:autotransporter-associated beta strand protein